MLWSDKIALRILSSQVGITSSICSVQQLKVCRRDTFVNRYAQYESDVITDTHGSSTVNEDGASHRQYDVNGDLIGITDDAESSNNRSYLNDAQGRALLVRQNGRTLRQLIVNGEVLGRYGSGVNPYDAKDDDNHPQFATIQDLNFTYQVVNATHPGSAPGGYVVAAGDTLQSIAKQQYGDAAYWYRIAMANGLDAGSVLAVGRKLDIPSLTGTTYNKADSFRPYDPSTVVGDTTPTLPPPDDGCGILQILVIAVAVVVTIYTAGATASALGATGVVGGGTSLASIGTAALTGGALTGAGAAVGVVSAVVGGVVGSIVSQGLAVALGVQKDINWSGVALSGLSAGITSGVGASGLIPGQTLAPTVARAMVANAITQGIGVVTGLQDHFSWSNVAAAGVGAAASFAVADALGMHAADFANASLGERLVKGTITGFAAGTAAWVARGGRVTGQQVATDAFGSALGNSIADSMVPTPKPTPAPGQLGSGTYNLDADVNNLSSG